MVKNLLKALKLNEATLSTLLGALVVIVVGILIFNYFSKVGEEGLPPEELVEEISEEVERVEGEPFVPKALPAKYTVASGDSLWSIAEKYYNSGYNWVDIAGENNLVSPDYINEGQELTIPKAEVRLLARLPETGDDPVRPAISADKYTVQKNDCLWNIAVRAYGDGFKWVEIAEANDLANPDLIHPGNEFVLP